MWKLITAGTECSINSLQCIAASCGNAPATPSHRPREYQHEPTSRMTQLQAHLICVGLVAADLIARVWRIQWIVPGVGYHMSFKDTLILNPLRDAACAVPPLPLG